MGNYLDKQGVATLWSTVKGKITDVNNTATSAYEKVNDLRDYVGEELDNIKANKADKEALITSVETIDNTKANKTELSNVLAEEVIEGPALEAINTLTRETIKKDLFIDLWNQACGRYGKYNAETGYFELNGLTDISYEEAIDIYNESVGDNFARDYIHSFSKCRTFLPINSSFGHFDTNSSYMCYSCTNLIAISFKAGNQQTVIRWHAFRSCAKLETIYGVIWPLGSTTNNTLFTGCYKLATIQLYGLTCDINLKDSPLLSLESFQYMITNATNTSPITITVHPDVYAKITDTTNTEWNQLLTDATNKQITFATV